jgi:glycosyltransferase 2 family protein
MRISRTILLLLGLLSVVVLARRIDVNLVRSALVQVGWGIVLVVGQETVAHLLNALGWRFAFTRDEAAAFPFGELFRLRVAGDAINYLTPSATVAGEFARAAMLSARHGATVRAGSVVVAKSAQTLGQAVFVAAGFFLVGTRLVVGAPRASPRFWLVAGGPLLILAILVYRATVQHAPGLLEPARARLRAVADRLREFIRDHPARVVLSTLMFVLAYAWGAFEAYWICHFLGIPVSVFTALSIEVLSVAVDGLLFMVPAKIGTQEGGKMAIFATLGLPPSLGFAFGVVRHVRELTWAGLGVLLCWSHRRPTPGLLSR